MMVRDGCASSARVRALGFASLLAASAATPAAAIAEDAPLTSPHATFAVVPQLLEAGDTLESEIRGEERHGYRLELPPGALAVCRVEQRGVDLVVEVQGPDGTLVRTMDDFFDTAGPLEFSVLTEDEQCVDFVVRPRLASSAAGSYGVSLIAVSFAEPRDAFRLRAEDALSDAVRLRRESRPDSLRRAVERLLEAAALSDEAGDLRGEANALNNAAFVHYLLSQPREGARLGERALVLAETAGDREGVSGAHVNLAVLYKQVGEVERAQQHYQQSIALMRELGDRRGQAISLSNLGVFLAECGDRQQALALLEQALSLRREIRDRLGEANSLANLGAAYLDLGEAKVAAEYLERSLSLTRAAADVKLECITLNLLGRALLDLGDSKGALDAHTRAIEMQRRSGDRRGEAVSLYNVGEAAVTLGDHARAITSFHGALALQQSIGNRRGEARALTALGSSLAARGETDAARTALEQALPLRMAVADRAGETVTRLALCRLRLESGDLEGARREITAAVDLVEALRTKITAQELRSGFLGSFRAVYDAEVDVLMRLDELEPGRGHAAEALSVHERGRARALLEALRESPIEIREGVSGELLDRERLLRLTLGSKTELQMRLLSRKEPAAEEAATVAREIDAVRLELDRVEAKIRAESPRFAALSPAQPLTLTEIQARVLDRETVLLEYALAPTRSYLWVVCSDRMTAHRLPRSSDLEPGIRRACELLAAPPNGDSSPSGEIDAILKELSKELIGPAAAAISGRRVVVVADGALQSFPFAALPDPEHPEEPLIARHDVVWLPSASVGATLRRVLEGRSRPTRTLAVFADPVFKATDERVQSRPAEGAATDGGGRRGASAGEPTQGGLNRVLREAGLEALPRLPFTRREAEAILSFVPASERFKALDFDARLDAVNSQLLSDFRIIHFATHGYLDASHPQYSGIVLSLVDASGEERRGFLSAADIFNLRLSADLVVLSGCRTGLGRVIAGEGVVGLTRAFLHAGAARVVASLWPVDDAATAELMRRFYEGMLGKRRLSPPAALREAQLALRHQRRWQSPFYWAGFQVQGEWR